MSMVGRESGVFNNALLERIERWRKIVGDNKDVNSYWNCKGIALVGWASTVKIRFTFPADLREAGSRMST